MAVSRRDGRAGRDVLRTAGEASVLVLISLADRPQHVPPGLAVPPAHGHPPS